MNGIVSYTIRICGKIETTFPACRRRENGQKHGFLLHSGKKVAGNSVSCLPQRCADKETLFPACRRIAG